MIAMVKCNRCVEVGAVTELCAHRVLPINFDRPTEEYFLYTKVPSDSLSDESLEVVAGEGTNTDTVVYVPSDHLAWIRSMGVVAQKSDVAVVTWNVGKYVRIKRAHIGRDHYPVVYDVDIGGAGDSDTNWEMLKAFSDAVYDTSGFPKQVTEMKFELVSQNNWHYWFMNKEEDSGEQYIKLVADVGAFTYDETALLVAMWMKVSVYDLNELLIV